MARRRAGCRELQRLRLTRKRHLCRRAVQVRLALAIYGGAGNDNCTIGNGDMAANLTNAAAFTFDGQADSDRFTISNGVTNTPWEYLTGNGFVRCTKSGFGYLWQSATNNIESQYFFAGSGGDSFNLDVVSPGVYTECNGFGGLDALALSLATDNLDTIRGPVIYNPGSDGGYIVARDSADTTGDVVHQTATTLGAVPGDTLFGPAGRSRSATWSTLEHPRALRSSSAAAPTIFAQPLAPPRDDHCE